MDNIPNPKYRLDRDHPVQFQGSTYFPIISLSNFHDVKFGDVGGCVENIHTLSHHGDCWIYEGVFVGRGGVVTEGAVVKDKAIVSGAMIFGNAVVSENAVVGGGRIGGYAEIKGNSIILGKPTIIDQSVVTEEAIIKGSGYISGCSVITGKAVLLGVCNISGNAIISGEVRDANLGWNAVCEGMGDYFVITNVGPFFEKLTAFKQGPDKKIMVAHSMWTMEIDEFEKDVMTFYKTYDDRNKKIIDEYALLLAYTRQKLNQG